MVPAFSLRIVKPREQGSGGQDKTLADQVSEPEPEKHQHPVEHGAL